ncbi:hypothetical protein T439DRAFT_346629 [Meredithblackwellia eburnea MCA 4105]
MAHNQTYLSSGSYVLNEYQPSVNVSGGQFGGEQESNGQTTHNIHSTALGGDEQGELVEVADKSCAHCRIRKVKCDRTLPTCVRCRKRGEACEYGEGVEKVMRRIPPKSGSKPRDAAHPYSHPSHSSYNPPATASIRPPSHSTGTGGDVWVSEAVGGSRVGSTALTSRDFASSWDAFFRGLDIGHRSIDWKLALPTMATSLTLSLLEESTQSCCFHLPAFHIFGSRISEYKAKITQLDLPSQVIVAILTSLGARASPHSALLGVEGPDIGDEGPKTRDHQLMLSAGRRRENAWRAITDRAVTLCTRLELMSEPSRANIEMLLAVTNMLLFSEVVPIQGRFFLRQAIGLYKDMHEQANQSTDLRYLKSTLGPSLYESDARTASYSNMPYFIEKSDLEDFFDGTGVSVPNLDTHDLGTELDDLLSPAWGPVTRIKLDKALSLTGYYVSAVQREYVDLATDRNGPRLHKEIHSLWSKIDRVHGAVQKLHRTLSSLDYTPEGCDHGHALDYDLLIGVRMDARMVDLVNLAHMRLLSLRERIRWTPDAPLLEEVIAISEKRVRKCLKLLAFYCKVYTECLDRHLLYHMVIQIQLLTPWVQMVVQRVGEPGGPVSPEYEVSELELDWFTEALKLACYYTPLAATRLEELQRGRDARRFTVLPSDYVSPPTSYRNTQSYTSSPSATTRQMLSSAAPTMYTHSHSHPHPHPQPPNLPKPQPSMQPLSSPVGVSANGGLDFIYNGDPYSPSYDTLPNGSAQTDAMPYLPNGAVAPELQAPYYGINPNAIPDPLPMNLPLRHGERRPSEMFGFDNETWQSEMSQFMG